MPELSYLGVLRTLVRHNVDFIVVGGIAAVLHGAPIITRDIDVVHSRTPENIARTLSALQDLDAYYRLHPERRLRPDASHLSSPGHQLLSTRFGPVDFLGTASRDGSYEQLMPHSIEMEVGENLTVRVLNLEKLIAIKEEIRGEKDLVMLPQLRRVLVERNRT